MVDRFSGMVFSLEKEENTVTCNSMDGPGEHYVEQRKTNTEWYLLNVKS